MIVGGKRKSKEAYHLSGNAHRKIPSGNADRLLLSEMLGSRAATFRANLPWPGATRLKASNILFHVNPPSSCFSISWQTYFCTTRVVYWNVVGTTTKMVPRIVLYAAHHCPFAQRSQIALRELGLPFETVLVDITVPRTADYLAINPRGLVPTLVYDGHVLAESGLIVQFPADAHPSHLLKSSSESGGPLQRFKIAFFVDTYFSKAHAFFNRAVYASAEDKIIASNKYIDAVVETIEPLLFDAAPFFGGSTHLTLAEVCPFLSRLNQSLST